MIIRHAEKPGDAEEDRGISASGHHNGHCLTVRGWQRAGALVRFFAPMREPADHPVSRPRAIFAAADTKKSPSLRSQLTVRPLAAALGISVDQRHAEGEEKKLARALIAAASPALVAWHHTHIADLVAAIAGDACCPQWWPDDRFDLVWLLDRDAPDAPWRFAQVAQQVLPGDRADTVG